MLASFNLEPTFLKEVHTLPPGSLQHFTHWTFKWPHPRPSWHKVILTVCSSCSELWGQVRFVSSVAFIVFCDFLFYFEILFPRVSVDLLFPRVCPPGLISLCRTDCFHLFPITLCVYIVSVFACAESLCLRSFATESRQTSLSLAFSPPLRVEIIVC